MRHASNNTLDYWREQTAIPGSNLYYASVFLPIEQRQKVVALHSVEAELNKIIFETIDPGVARLRLNWWLEQFLSTSQDAATMHPLIIAIRELVPAAAMTCLAGHIRALDNALASLTMTDPDKMVTTFAGELGGLWQLSANPETYTPDSNPQTNSRPATEAPLIRRLAGLQHYSQTLQNIPQQQRLGRLHDNITDLDKMFAIAETGFKETFDALGNSNTGNVLHLLIFARLELALIREIRRDGCQVIQQRYALTPLRKLWIAWRCQRRAN
ncbi:MAG: squalene/phytoene synthase family protein [Gammaproteobacteria bacterium]